MEDVRVVWETDLCMKSMSDGLTCKDVYQRNVFLTKALNIDYLNGDNLRSRDRLRSIYSILSQSMQVKDKMVVKGFFLECRGI
ncbi:hypothetical protein Fmac_005359 [Flemingia macrophylla]|uniref:Uncharacterized protein n=1 Tax=Flemingia macrophylla TaxID=520843 RepID=A0ABD1N7L9_9FABA